VIHAPGGQSKALLMLPMSLEVSFAAASSTSWLSLAAPEETSAVLLSSTRSGCSDQNRDS
jgi:hypothetical protein